MIHTHVTVTAHGQVVFHRYAWTADDMFTAECLGFEVDPSSGNITADIAKTKRQALLAWMKEVVYDFWHQKSDHQKLVMQTIKQWYAYYRSIYTNNYYPRLKYSRTLYDHQNDTIISGLGTQHNLFALDMGLGKTITTSSLSKMMNYGRTIIVCPALVKWNWMRDMSGWGYNNMYWSIYDAKPSKTKRAFIERFVVVNFETIEKHFNTITADSCEHIIIDECHYIKNHKSGRYKNVERLVKKYPNARVTLLSGTPFTNRINDMFAYLKLCGHPLGRDYKAFLDRYTDYSQGSRGMKIRGSKNIDELKLRISNFMIRKKTEECIDLPPLLINNYYFSLDDDDFRKQYDEILGDIVAQEEEREQLDGQEKRQKTIAMNGNLTKLNRLVTMTKIKDAIKLIDSINEEGRKAIVFSGFTGPLDMLLKHYGRKAVKIDGSVDSHKRDLIVEQFKNDEEVMVFLGNNKAAGVGINLVNASDVILLNLPWTPDDIEQPFKRAHRIGQNRTVNVYILLAMQTVDEYIYNLITDKAGDINKLIDDDNTKGVIRYDSIPGDLFKALIDEYRSSHGMAIKERGKGNLIQV
jgi:SNF2 family DNA or RNA helicase